MGLEGAPQSDKEQRGEETPISADRLAPSSAGLGYFTSDIPAYKLVYGKPPPKDTPFDIPEERSGPLRHLLAVNHLETFLSKTVDYARMFGEHRDAVKVDEWDLYLAERVVTDALVKLRKSLSAAPGGSGPECSMPARVGGGPAAN